jgi:hypothetical protein
VSSETGDAERANSIAQAAALKAVEPDVIRRAIHRTDGAWLAAKAGRPSLPDQRLSTRGLVEAAARRLTPVEGMMIGMTYGEAVYGEGAYTALANAVSDPTALNQFQRYVNDMSPVELLALLGWMWQSLNATLDDPERGLYTTLLLLPFLAVVLRAIRKSRGD